MRFTKGVMFVMFTALAGCAALVPQAPNVQGRNASTKTVTAPKPVKIEPPVKAESRQMYEQALVALKAGRYPEAERMLRTVASREPELAGPYANLGIVYVRLGRSAQAIEALQQAIRLNPDRAAYYNELGMVFRREGKFDDARRQYAKALDADPEYANAHLNIGILYDLYLQDVEKAMRRIQGRLERALGAVLRA